MRKSIIITALFISLISACNIVEFDRTVTIYNETNYEIKDLYLFPESELPDLSSYENDLEFKTYCEGLYTDQLPDETEPETTLPDEENIVINLETIDPNTSNFVIVAYDDFDIVIKHFSDSEEFITLTTEDFYNFYPEIGVFTP